MRPVNRALALRLASLAAAAAVLAAIGAWYLNPHMVVDLANRVWSCL